MHWLVEAFLQTRAQVIVPTGNLGSTLLFPKTKWVSPKNDICVCVFVFFRAPATYVGFLVVCRIKPDEKGFPPKQGQTHLGYIDHVSHWIFLAVFVPGFGPLLGWVGGGVD